VGESKTDAELDKLQSETGRLTMENDFLSKAFKRWIRLGAKR